MSFPPIDGGEYISRKDRPRSQPLVLHRMIPSGTCYIYIIQEEFEDTKGATRICVSKKNRQHNGQKKQLQKDKTRSTKHTYKRKDRVTRTQLKTGDGLRWSGRVRSSCSISDTRRVNLVTNPVISLEWWKDREVFTTCGTYPWSFVT